jgi:hypothetical protein
MNWYKIFYALTVSDGVKSFFDVASNIFTFFVIISLIAFLILLIVKSITISDNNLQSDEEEKKDADSRAYSRAIKYIKPFFYVMLGCSILTWTAWAATPTKKDCIMIIAGGSIGNFLTTDTNARKLPPELMKLGVVAVQAWQEEIKNIPLKDRQNLGIEPIVKEKPEIKSTLVERFGDMTKEEIIKFIQTDTTLLK